MESQTSCLNSAAPDAMIETFRCQARYARVRARFIIFTTWMACVAAVIGISLLAENTMERLTFGRIRVAQVPQMQGWASAQVQNPPENDPRDAFLKVVMEKQNLEDALRDRTWGWTEITRIVGIISITILAILAVRLLVMFAKYHHRMADQMEFVAGIAEGYEVQRELCVRLLGYATANRIGFGKDPEVPVEKLAAAVSRTVKGTEM